MLVAALVEVGHGRMTPRQVGQLLESGDRGKLPEAAPPQGLYLLKVLYELPPGVEALPKGKSEGGESSDGGEGGDTE